MSELAPHPTWLRDRRVRDVIVRWLAQRTTDHDAMCAIAHLYSPTLVPGRPTDHDPDLEAPF